MSDHLDDPSYDPSHAGETSHETSHETSTASGTGPNIRCDMCGRAVGLYDSYVVRIDVFAEPGVPPLSTPDGDVPTLDDVLADVLEQVEHLTADDLQDGVFRRFEHRVCPACQRQFLVNPLGLPRRRNAGRN